MEIRPLRATDARAEFRSGDPDLDRFFAKYAGQNQFRHHLGVTYVAVEDGILGFATVAPATIEADVLPAALRKKLPAYPLPTLRLARLAVATDARARGVGKRLLRHVFGLAIEMADRYGCVGIVVDAKQDALAFYERFGFVVHELTLGASGARPAPTPMFLPLALVLAAVRPSR